MYKGKEHVLATSMMMLLNIIMITLTSYLLLAETGVDFNWTTKPVTIIAVLLSILACLQVRFNRQLRTQLIELNQRDIKLKKLSSAVTNSGASIIITDRFGRIEYVNNTFTNTTGFAESDVRNEYIDILNPPSSEGNQPRWGQELLTNGWEGEVFSRNQNSNHFWSALTVSSVLNSNGNVTNFVISGLDITELKEANNKMHKMALYDALTGLANRRLFIDRLEQSLQAARRDKKKIALLFLDLDKFKRINDTLGHDAGDILLTSVAQRLKKCVRAKDTVARLGGDEFTLLLTDIEDNLAATHVAQNILVALKEPIKLKKHEVIVSTSIGITIAPEDANTTEKLMKNADLALYRAKEQGRDCYHYFTEELNQRALQQLIWEQELRHAIQFDEFTLYFQPQIDLKTNEVVSVEALLRWHHPSKGLVRPLEFIDVAEETGLIIPMGRWVIRNACMQMKMLHDLTGKKLNIAVNLSVRQFEDPSLVDYISEVLNESGLNPHLLEVEVTESMLMDNLDGVVKKLIELKRMGVSISIDDFGSGYSSLSYLKKLPVNTLKVDKEFVKDIPADFNNMEITSAIIAVAHKLNLKVIAEGVENAYQRDFLLVNQCDYAQGYFYSRPLSFEAFYDYLSPDKQPLNAATFTETA